MNPTSPNPATIAAQLSEGERAALRSLPARDRGHMPDELWWAYYAIMDAGLSTSRGDFLMIPTPLGDQVLQALDHADGAQGGSHGK